jgi:hypothetical protein
MIRTTSYFSMYDPQIKVHGGMDYVEFIFSDVEWVTKAVISMNVEQAKNLLKQLKEVV